jgi:hypothetical protein
MTLNAVLKAASRRLPIIVLVLGLGFTFMLQASIVGEVFVTGDAGVKYLLMKNYASGRFTHDLDLHHEPWVARLWQAGLYPLEYPARVQVQGHGVLFYHFLFPLLSAVPYRLLGYRGLYLLPLVTTWLLWWIVYRACRALEFHPLTTSLALLALIFGSPLTYYSAAFWEHSPAWFLTTCGLLFIIVFHGPKRFARILQYLGGFLIGSTALLREETLIVAALVAVLAGVMSWRRLSLIREIRLSFFMSGLFSGVILFGVVNSAVYGHPLGIHAVATLDSAEWGAAPPLRILKASVASLLRFFPLSIIVIPAGLVFLLNRESDRFRRGLFLCLLALGIIVCIPPIVRYEGGRQWGPRYVLLAVPLIVLAAGLIVEWARRRKRSAFAVAPILACILWGVWINAPGMTRSLYHNYETRMIPLRYVRAVSTPAVAVTHQFVTQQLVAALDEKPFFLTKNEEQLRKLTRELYRRGWRSHLLLCHTLHNFDPFDGEPERVRLLQKDGKAVAADYVKLGYVGRYAAYKAIIRSRD